MNTSIIKKTVLRNRSLLQRLRKKIDMIYGLRFGGLLVNDNYSKGGSIDSYYPGGDTYLGNYTKVGYWTYNGDFLDIPKGGGGTVQVIHSAGSIIQLAISRDNGLMGKRISTNEGNIWSEWEMYLPASMLPKRQHQVGVVAIGESIIHLTSFELDAEDPFSYTLFLDGILMMESFPCDQAGVKLESGTTSYLKISESYKEGLPYAIFNTTNIKY